MYQPQIESWDSARLVAHSAISVERDGGFAEAYGVLWISARTEVDKEQRLATLEDFEFTRASFPSVPEKTDEWLADLRKHVPTHAKTVELDRLETSLAVARAQTAPAQVAVSNEAPQILFSSTPAILVLLDGAPVARPVPGTTGLTRIINTRALLLRGEDGRFHLGVG